ncbi:unnamed protein product [Cylindrotheca closterium]|uniref:Uncharacterized protein n=1 Tax=Cylindrotheca closterium TaxID=2856 RepID=A0AAD2G6Y4_9STRA|nr:unnamed protein product [Cylindrotheca closterium]
MPKARISLFGSLTIWGVILCVGTLMTSSIESFAPIPSLTSTSTRTSRTFSTSLRSIFGDDDKEEVKDGVDFQSFNPLNYQAAGNTKQNQQYSIQISLRQVQMKEMTGELLEAVGDEATTNEILARFKDFLLEPLDDPDAVLVSEKKDVHDSILTGGTKLGKHLLSDFLCAYFRRLQDPDSIYTPQMSRAERYDAYRSSMDERIQNSKNGGVRSILQSMRDFVLSFEAN